MLKLHISKLLLLLLLIGFSATYFLQRQAFNATHQIQQENFDYQTREMVFRIEQRLTSYEQVLLGTKALFVASKNVARNEFRNYVGNLHLENRYPGIQGVGFSLIIRPSEKAKHIQAIRNEGFSSYTLKPEGERDLYTSIIYLEPFTGRNLRAFGYDMFSETVRHTALEQARDLDKATISGKVKLIQESEQQIQAGFLMFVPVYRNDLPHDSLDERRANIIGWVYAPFRMDDFMQGILGEQVKNIDLLIYDGEATTPEALMYHNNGDLPQRQTDTAEYRFAQKIDIIGHIWTIRLEYLPTFEATINTKHVTLIRLTGVLTTLLLALLIVLLASGRLRALKLAELMTHDLRDSEFRWKFAIEGSGDGLWDWNIPEGKVFFTKLWKEMLGFAESEIGDGLDEWEKRVHSDDKIEVFAVIQAYFDGKIPHYINEHRVLCKDGSYKWILDRGIVVSRSEDGKPLRMIGTHKDITERKQNEEKLRLAANVFTHAREGIMITEPDGTIIDVNVTFSHITGYSRDEVIGHNPSMLSSDRYDKEYYTTMWRDLIEKGHWYGEIWNRHKNGEVYAEMQNISAVRDAHGKTQNYVSLFSDITLIKEHEQELEHIAHYDALTNLPNRVLLADRLQQYMPQVQRREQHLVVVFLDLDGFKAINDNHGHKAGDQLLMTVALRMKQTLREGDTLARLGGDEFVAVLTDLINIEASVPMLTRLLAAAAQPVHIGDLVLQVSASLGATAYPQVEDIDADQLLRQADQAMYQAKLAGKNRYHIFDAAHDTSIRVRHESLDRIHEAIIKQEFVLYYQPKVNMRTGAIIGAEALIRWDHPEKGLLSPALFLPDIEDHPLAIELGEWVIGTALTQIELWRNQGLDIKVSVNIGARQLQQDNFVTRLREILAAHPDIMPSYLELEVLETSALEDITKVSGLIDDCRRIGVSFALDDFGTGYSSLTYLRRLPVALLKIDQSFVRDMLNDPDDLAIIEGIVGLACTFRREVIAEGVETIEHGTLLLKLGCDMAQGYGIARPMPADQIPKWSLTWRPDSAWVDQPLMSHDDLPLLFASLEQRSWIAAIEAFLKGERDAPLPLDPDQSRLSMWLNTQTLANYSAHPAFEAIDSLYRQIQVLSTELCELHTLGKNSEALARLSELHDLGDALIEQLKVPVQKTKH
jgi:diguanylate cyclase (GGDEF)-like protein/PAS domain S-box-containing protein